MLKSLNFLTSFISQSLDVDEEEMLDAVSAVFCFRDIFQDCKHVVEFLRWVDSFLSILLNVSILKNSTFYIIDHG